MNIHFTDKNLFEDLKLNNIAKIKVGSHLYGLDNNKSDEDFLYIYLNDNLNSNSFLWEHHQLQFKENSIDHNFSTLQTFIRNVLTGDATINFEVLFSDELKKSELSWLWEKRNNFINYNIIKSYLGLSKRDLKYYKKDTSNLRFHTEETNKKLSHFIRGIIFSKMLLNNNFTLDLKSTRTFDKFDYNDWELLNKIKIGLYNDDIKSLIDYFEKEMDSLREELNNRNNDRTIKTYMDIEELKILDKKVMEFTSDFKNKKNLDYDYLFYESLENGIKY